MSEDSEKKTIPTYSFSQIRYEDLNNLVDIKRKFDKSIFDDWFKNETVLDDKTVLFLEELLEREENYIKIYDEKNLITYFIAPIINKVNFKVLGEIRGFYEGLINYKHKDFIFNGKADFVVSKGFRTLEKPLFFIQEFKKGTENTNPEPQLLAELISAIELNNWTQIKGAYIVGSAWNFVILKKIGKDKYQFYVSDDFYSVHIEDLKKIYKNLLFVKKEIIRENIETL